MNEPRSEFPPIVGARSYEEQDLWIADAMRSVARRKGRCIQILEAGCGNRWPIDLRGTDYRLTGADLDAAALKLRLALEHDLDEAIQGDLSSMALPEEGFDVVYSAYVLEHIRDADIALDNLVRALKPGGLLVLRIPDPETARGFVTRRTPFWFHVFYHRRVMKRPMAGKPGYAPYPTYYHPVIYQQGMQAYARGRHLQCQGRYSDDFVRDGKGVAGVVFRTGARLLSLLSGGRLTCRYNDLTYLLVKPESAAAPQA